MKALKDGACQPQNHRLMEEWNTNDRANYMVANLMKRSFLYPPTRPMPDWKSLQPNFNMKDRCYQGDLR